MESLSLEPESKFKDNLRIRKSLRLMVNYTRHHNILLKLQLNVLETCSEMLITLKSGFLNAPKWWLVLENQLNG